jgi:hypothetical protein
MTIGLKTYQIQFYVFSTSIFYVDVNLIGLILIYIIDYSTIHISNYIV